MPDVDLRRLRIGEWITGIGGVALIAALFLDWFSAGNTAITAWEAFSVGDLFLVFFAALAIGTAVMAAAHNTPAVSLALASLALLVGLVALVYVVIRGFSTPALEAEGGASSTRDVGWWLGLLLTLVVNGGALASMRDERFPRGARIEVPVETLPPPEGGKA